MTATAWRQHRKGGQPDRKLGEVDSKAGKAGPPGELHDHLCPSDDAGQHQEDIMTVTIKSLPNYHVAYMRHTGPYGAGGGIPQLWQKLQRWAEARDLWTSDRVCLGIAIDDPMVTEPAKCRYDAAVVVPADFKADSAVNLLDVPGGKHATVAFEGSSQRVAEPWAKVFSWLPQSGYQPDNRLGFELYVGEAWDGKTDAFRCEVCVPVRPL